MARIHVPVPVRWSDLDAYGHVNNATTLRLLEEARIQVFWAPTAQERGVVEGGGELAVIDASSGSDTLTFIARQEIEYLAPIPYLRTPLDVQLWIGRLGGASIDICYEIHPPAGVDEGTVYARAGSTTVLVDAATRTPRRITDEERAIWEPYVGEPIEFRR